MQMMEDKKKIKEDTCSEFFSSSSGYVNYILITLFKTL